MGALKLRRLKMPGIACYIHIPRWLSIISNLSVNPLTTNDDYSHHQNSAACYRLAQSVLKIGSALAERVGQGEVCWCIALADSAWWLL